MNIIRICHDAYNVNFRGALPTKISKEEQTYLNNRLKSLNIKALYQEQSEDDSSFPQLKSPEVGHELFKALGEKSKQIQAHWGIFYSIEDLKNAINFLEVFIACAVTYHSKNVTSEIQDTEKAAYEAIKRLEILYLEASKPTNSKTDLQHSLEPMEQETVRRLNEIFEKLPAHTRKSIGALYQKARNILHKFFH